ncbi:TPA: hypothetical protein I9768_002888 [Legionella pneumophila]|uniref:hypothetical protein n=1 Tax=Legionella pneumophila TaxID=446 RepID=UPI001A21570A|nr:hypothetical protein [Legionella pneumophila]MCZ4759506.1 hypothetical protein [Legionella pneumophila]HAT1962815.1 hypothetical protein [Legionella pneumophila]HAT1976101.1 hypothetical protein [Legionella pneumophila]HAT2029634.1 hypothetical protein [Legionella pneumophila]HAT5017179.1 hypothetical protein [Legionella pneumophila]
MNNNYKNALLFVQISTHFREIFRVARLMKKRGAYSPKVFFVAPYEGWKQDFQQCQSEGIECICYFEKLIQNKSQIQNKSGIKLVLKWIIISIRAFYRKSFKKIKFVHPVVKFCFFSLMYLLKKSKVVLGYLFISVRIVLYKAIIQICNNIISPKTLSNFLLSCYKIIWNKTPQLLPPISKTAYYFYNYLPSLLLENRIQLIVLPEHNLFYFTQLLVYQGRKYQIPAIIVPFTIANTIEWSEAFYNEPSRALSSIPNKIFARAFPHWVNHYKNRSLLLPVELILLHEMFGITPKNTWLLNSGDIDFLASESEAMKNYYISAGIEEEQIRVTGALYNDELFFRLQKAEDFRDQLYEKLNMQPGKPMLLCALPPNQCFGRMDLIEFGSYEEIVRFILSKLSQYDKDYNIIVNLHPRIVLDTVSYISDYPVKIYTGNIAEIIPLSSIFVASCSATIRMAISCGIPVVNYDLYHYNYDDYQNIKGVLTMNSKFEFSSILNKLITESGFFEIIKTAQLSDSEKWGVLDGKSGENLLNEIDLLFA